MAIAAGKRLGPYEIVAPIGAGGMGEVWRARDTRLDREVAVKVLSPGYATSDGWKARFEREARAISQLSHPHVCALYDVGEAPVDGESQSVSYLVMELLEGESLAARLARGPLPLQEVLRLGQQIALALAAAHRRGIVHRDLKPANVMITRGGAKLLDFGLAKSARGSVPALGGLASLPTSDQPLTQEGTLLGTFQYMAPEQLEGLEADARTDIFALGALLYEMATGRRAFQGASKTSLIAAIVSGQPEPISAVMPMMPPALDHVVRRCLQKDPEDRWQSAHDVATELEWVAEAGSQAGVSKAAVSSRALRRRMLAGAAVLGWLTVSVLGAVAWRQRAVVDEAQRPFQADLLPPRGTAVAFVSVGAVAISPDASRLLLVAAADGGTALQLRDLRTGETTTVAGTEGAIYPFWSPDGEWIGFFARGKLRKVPAAGGPVQSLADALEGRGGTWGEEGIVFAPDILGPLLHVSDSGDVPRPVTRTEGDSWTHRNPYLLPGGRHVLYVSRQGGHRIGKIAIASVADGTSRVLVEEGSNPQYAAGHLFWVREGNLLAQPFDPRSLELSGKSVPIADHVEYYSPRDMANFSVSAELLAWKPRNVTRTRLARVDRNGREVESFGEPGLYTILDFSRDGRKVLLSREDETGAGSDLWVADLDRRQFTRVTFLSSPETVFGVFSLDGERLAVTGRSASGEMRGSRLWIQPASAGGDAEHVLDAPFLNVEDWSEDGGILLVGMQAAATSHDIGYLDLAKPKALARYRATPHLESSPRLSPDGRWIAYLSDDAGRTHLYLGDFPGGTRRWQVSGDDEPNTVPVWSSRGDVLYYGSRKGLHRAALSPSGDSLDPRPPELVSFDVSRLVGDRFHYDGDTVLALARAEEPAVGPVRLMRSWRSVVGATTP